jgi:hypothetical protein
VVNVFIQQIQFPVESETLEQRETQGVTQEAHYWEEEGEEPR